MIKRSIVADQLRDVHHADLRGFMERYFGADCIQIRPPQKNLLIVEGVTSVVLYRDPPFQVELIIVAPNVDIPQHCHDDVDSYEVAFSGGIDFFIDGIQSGFAREPRADGMMRDFGKFVPIASDAWHGGKASAEGACFLSVQRWRDGRSPTHVGQNWRGPSMGSIHDEVI